MKILVTGGAGYIGSILTEELVSNGHEVIVLDNLSRGHRAAVAPEAIFIPGELGSPGVLEAIFAQHSVGVVMHLAADTSVEQSMVEPGRFFTNNVTGGINLLECMVKHGIKKLVFSSSAAVYGEPEEIPVTEGNPLNPVNAYGESKLMFERILYWYWRVYRLSSISLRYFNVAGASKRFGQDHHPETLLIPRTVRVASGQEEYVPVFGTDYDTGDGTGIRDYIHVLDIARAHILALEYLAGNAVCRAYNLGNGEGYSVMEVVEAARRVTGASVPVKVHPRRPGDAEKVVASSSRAKADLGWEPRHPGLEGMIESTWQWRSEHPRGYETGYQRVSTRGL